MRNVKIKEIEIAVPKTKFSNDYYIDHFKRQGKNIEGLLEIFGRNERYVGDKHKENTVSLGISAAKKVLKKANLEGKDIDMILFASQFPQNTCPIQALQIHKAIGGKFTTMVQDVNSNCLGMLAAVDEAVRYLKQKDRFNTALIVGADCMTYGCDINNEYTYPMFGDLGCALILEKTDEEGVVGSTYMVNSEEADTYVLYPKEGFYNNIKPELKWIPFDASFVPKCTKDMFEDILVTHNMKFADIDHYCLSQYAKSMLEGIIKELDEPEEKFIYIGDRYGYTGTSSPFVAFYEGIKQGKIHRGEYVAFWSVGVYWTSCAIILRY